MATLLIGFIENKARQALADEIIERTGDTSVTAETIVDYLNRYNANHKVDGYPDNYYIVNGGSDLVNAWEHAYVSAYLCNLTGSEDAAYILGVAKELYVFPQLFTVDTLHDLYNDLAGIDIAKNSSNLDEIKSNLFESMFNITSDDRIEQNLLTPPLVIDPSTDERYKSPNALLQLERILIKYNPLAMVLSGSLFHTAQSTPAIKIDPLLLDLDGDGIETTTIANGVYFDHDKNGFAQSTAWVGADDGILAIDKNNNGTIDDGGEVFGDNYTLYSGTKATTGFQALADLDYNGDGMISSLDADFSAIKVLKGDGTLITLADAGIQSINIANTTTSITDANGNTQLRSGTYTKTDGITTGTIGDYSLAQDLAYSVATDWIEVSAAISALPDAQGAGTVYSLHQAMARDTSGALTSLVQQFANTTDLATKRTILTSIIYKWTGADTVTAGSRGTNIDAKVLHVLEKFMGEGYIGVDGTANPNNQAGNILNGSYATLSNYIYSQLESQTTLKPLYDLITLEYDATTDTITTNLSAVTTAIQAAITANATAGQNTLFDFDNTFKSLGLKENSNYTDFYNTFVAMNESYKFMLDASDKTSIYGTTGNDSLDGSSRGEAYMTGEGNDTIYSRQGDDVIYAGNGNDNIDACEGNDYIDAGAGYNTIFGGAGDDHVYNNVIGSYSTYHGEAGNDTIETLFGYDTYEGGTGNDVVFANQSGSNVYIFSAGDGQDTITDLAYNPDIYTDTIKFGAGIAQRNVCFTQSSNDMLITFENSTDSITIKDWFVSDANKIEQFQFSDDSIITRSQIVVGTQVGDNVNTVAGNYFIYGGEGNDTVTGNSGSSASSVIFGGSGNDSISMINGTGSTTTSITGIDTILGGDGDDSIIAGVASTGLTVTYGNKTIDGGAGNDYIYNNSFGAYSTFKGGDGNDTIETLAGHDTYEGGRGNDVIFANQSGNNLYIFNVGDGQDTITDLSYVPDIYTDTIKFGAGITKYNTLFSRDADNMVISFDNSTDKITIQNWFVSDTYKIENFQFSDNFVITRGQIVAGTISADTLGGTTGNDFIYGEENNDAIVGNGGSDFILGNSGSDNITVSTGNNYIDGGNDGDTITVGFVAGYPATWGSGNDTILGKAGNDSISSYYGVDSIDGGVGNDTIYTYYTAAGTIVKGGDGNDSITSKYSGANYEGGKGNDFFYNEQSVNNTYIFNKGDGQDTITDTAYGADGYTDILQFGTGISKDNILFTKEADNMVIKFVGSADTITITNWFTSEANKIESFQFSDGSTVAKNQILFSVLGTAGNDNLTGTIAGDIINGADGNDTITDGYVTGLPATWGTGNDTILGGSGSDSIKSYYGVDSIDGGAGDDTIYSYYTAAGTIIRGGDGNDSISSDFSAANYEGGLGNDLFNNNQSVNNTYFFNTGDGQDTITDYAYGADGYTDIIQFGANIVKTDVIFVRTGNDLTVSISNTTDSITIKNWYTSTLNQIEQFKFSDNSIITNSQVKLSILGTTESDSILGTTDNDAIYGLTGNDTIDGGVGADTMLGGIGDDTYIVDNAGDVVTENANEGIDNVNSSISYTLSANIENLTLTGTAALNATGNSLDNILTGNSGNNTLTGGAGNDVYVFNPGFGQDTIIDSSGIDTVRFTSGVTTSDIELFKYNNDLVISIKNSTNKITLTGWYTSDTNKIESFEFSNGTVLTNQDISNMPYSLAPLNLVGTSGNDSLVGAEGNDTITDGYVTGLPATWGTGNDTISGGTGNDSISSYYGIDSIDGGAGEDTIYSYYTAPGTIIKGGDGNDSITSLYSGANYEGGLGNDIFNNNYSVNNTYFFNSGDGQDTITDYAYGADGYTDIIQFGANIAKADVIFVKSGNDLVANINNTTDSITIKNWYISTFNQIEQFKFSDNSIITKDQVVLTFLGTSGNDSLTGSSTGDIIIGADGNDTITDGGTTGALNWGPGNDTIRGGAGNDSISDYYGVDDIDGGTGDDYIYSYISSPGSIIKGGDGNDTITSYVSGANFEGGLGNDIINSGQSVGNTYFFNKGDGQDTITDSAYYADGYTDIIQFGADVVKADVYFVKSGNDLIANINNTTDSITIKNWYTSSFNQIEQFKFSDNSVLTSSQIVLALSGTTGNDSLVGTTGADTLIGGVGNDTLTGGTGNDTYIFNSGDGNDTINDSAGTDKISLGSTINKDKIAVFMSGTDLVIDYGSTIGQDKIVVLGQTNANNAVEKIQLSDGTYISNTDVNQLIQTMTAYATANSIQLTSVNDVKNNQDLMTMVANSWHS